MNLGMAMGARWTGSGVLIGNDTLWLRQLSEDSAPLRRHTVATVPFAVDEDELALRPRLVDPPRCIKWATEVESAVDGHPGIPLS